MPSLLTLLHRRSRPADPPPCPLCGRSLLPVRVAPVPDNPHTSDWADRHDAAIGVIEGADWYCRPNGDHRLVKYFVNVVRTVKREMAANYGGEWI